MRSKGVKPNFKFADESVHPTLRFDKFLRTHDATFQTEKNEVGDRYQRTFPLYGSLRPSPSFTGVSRVVPFKQSFDLSNLPPTWNDMRGDKREGSYSYNPTSPCDNEFFQILNNHSLMLPSERRAEADRFKKDKALYEKSRSEYAEYTKRRRTLRSHQSGIVGIDGPMNPDSELYAYEASRVRQQEERREGNAEKRRANLAQLHRSSDATAQRGWLEEPTMDPRAMVPLQRKCVDPDLHPFRFLNTHERVFPSFVPTFDPERARILHHHEVREKRYDILHHGSNKIHGIRRATLGVERAKETASAAELGIGIGWRTD